MSSLSTECSEQCLTVFGDNTALAYSNLGLTREKYDTRLVAESLMSLQILLIKPSVLLAFAAVISICYDNDISLETVISKSVITVTCSSC